MGFSKSFPRVIKGSNYPVWEEITLSDEEEKIVEEQCTHSNIVLMKACIKHAKDVVADSGYKEYQSDIIKVALSLFDKIASHQVYHKENLAKEKFDKKFGEK